MILVEISPTVRLVESCPSETMQYQVFIPRVCTAEVWTSLHYSFITDRYLFNSWLSSRGESFFMDIWAVIWVYGSPSIRWSWNGRVNFVSPQSRNLLRLRIQKWFASNYILIIGLKLSLDLSCLWNLGNKSSYVLNSIPDLVAPMDEKQTKYMIAHNKPSAIADNSSKSTAISAYM